MGKNLKGKECGKGICQRKDGLYKARFSNSSGNRTEKHFKTLTEARNWLAQAQRQDQVNRVLLSQDLTVDGWFDFWIGNIVCDLAPNTIRNYRDRYTINIKPIIGNMKLTDVKPMHCKVVLNQMTEDYSGGTIRQAYITMGSMLRSAVNNDLLTKHPMDGVRFSKAVRAVDEIKYLTVEEQQIFMKQAKNSHNYYQYALLLETGLRTGEMIGLTWDCIDWEHRTLTVNKTLEYRHSTGVWRAGPPKTINSYRTIPLTSRAYDILKSVEAQRETRKQKPLVDKPLEFLDRKTGKKQILCMKDLVFINWRTGEPAKNSSYDTHLYKLCDAAGIKRISMHALRHTYATRAIEAGMQPKVLQKLLGHASINTTMDRYVHVTDDSFEKAIEQFEQYTIG